MNRRQLFPALAAALTLAPVAALAKLEPEITETAQRDLGVKCAGCGEGPHFHRLSRVGVFNYSDNSYSYSLEKWATPKGEVCIQRWPTMDDGHTRQAVEDAMMAAYPQ